MFCPKCGQSQNSEMMRFCPRCGFQLTAVSDLMFTDGVPSTGQGKPSAFQRFGNRPGAKIIFFSLILAPFLLMASFFFDSPAPLVLAFAIFILGVAEIAYAQLFGAGLFPGKSDPALKAGESRPVLSPTTGEPIGWGPAKGTAEIVQPPSVTEPTTKLLDLEVESDNN